MALAPQFKNISLSQLKAATYNPKRRTKNKNVRQLAASMAEVGLMYPILVTKQSWIIDGHRRFEAAKMNQWDTIPCLVVDDKERDKVYAEVNANACRLSGNDNLFVYLENPNAVTATCKAKFDAMCNVIGRELARDIQKFGFSFLIYRMAREVCKQCGKESPEMIRRTVRWFMTCESVGYVRNLLVSQVISPMLVLRHVKQNKPLKMKVS
jgi:hypothetical protein